MHNSPGKQSNTWLYLCLAHAWIKAEISNRRYFMVVFVIWLVQYGKVNNLEQFFMDIFFMLIVSFTYHAYHQTSNIRCTESLNWNVSHLILQFSCLCPIHWSQVWSREWRCNWSSTNRWCSNYIWVTNNFIAYNGVPYIRGLIVHQFGIDWQTVH